MTYEEAILVKIDKDTKRRMKSVKVNWSERIREFIQKEISTKRRNRKYRDNKENEGFAIWPR
jgi:post-segregation antitoxin (ccd killing protein)